MIPMKLKQDDIITAVIADYGMEGEGIARLGEYTVFIPFAIKGETVKAKVTYVRKNLVFADLKEIITPSDKREKYECNRFMRCGGCDLLHLNYCEQLEIKQKNVINLLHKNAKIDFPVDPAVPSPKTLAYRNKIQLPFGTVNGKVAVGFYKENTHKIVSITKCFLHGDWVERLISVFLEFASSNNLTAYDDATRTGLLRHLVARYIDGKISIVLVINGQTLPFSEKLTNHLDAAFSDAYSLYISPKTEPDNVVMGKSVYPLVERDFTINIMGIELAINPYSFLQLNDDVRDLIYSRVISEIEKTSPSVVIDAYAGVGLMGAVSAKRGSVVYNIEIVPEAVRDAEKLAASNNLSSLITNIEGDAAKELPKLIKDILGNQNLKNRSLNIILDPPRKGCSPDVTNALNSLDVPHNLFYISCNPATLTRDLALLKNYTINSITPYDMFPQTKHVECVTLMSKVEK